MPKPRRSAGKFCNVITFKLDYARVWLFSPAIIRSVVVLPQAGRPEQTKKFSTADIEGDIDDCCRGAKRFEIFLSESSDIVISREAATFSSPAH